MIDTKLERCVAVERNEVEEWSGSDQLKLRWLPRHGCLPLPVVSHMLN